MFTPKNLLTRAICFSLLIFFFGTAAANACIATGADDRLSAFCLVKKYENTIIPPRFADMIDYRLKNIGISHGIGRNTEITKNRNGWRLNPILDYSNNINGGNAPKPLVLGDLRFDGDPDLYRKEGIILGAQIGNSGRYIRGEGQYLTYDASASYARSPKYNDAITTVTANFCNVQALSSWRYIDFCINRSRVRKTITDQTNSSMTIKASKLVASANGMFSMLSLGIKRYATDNYIQSQGLIDVNTIHASGAFSKINITLGAPVTGETVTRRAISAQVTKLFARKPMTISANISKSDGGKIIGYDRAEHSYLLNISYPIWKNVTAGVGYQVVDSTIDYFDAKTPIFNINFAAIAF